MVQNTNARAEVRLSLRIHREIPTEFIGMWYHLPTNHCKNSTTFVHVSSEWPRYFCVHCVKYFLNESVGYSIFK